jgi:hypothetical protein
MSLFYPISCIEKLVSLRTDRTLTDPFESGATSARRSWPTAYFKRRFSLLHAPLTQVEWRALRSLYTQVGQYDSFWFRDNVHREGNALVRFAAPLEAQYQGITHRVALDLLEIAPIRSLPEPEEIALAAGTAPILVLDANREQFYSHVGTTYTDSNLYDASNTFTIPWRISGFYIHTYLTSQYAAYIPGTGCGQSTANWAPGVTKPAFTAFAFTNFHPNSRHVLLCAGAAGSTSALGLTIDGNYFRPYIGDHTSDWGGLGVENSPVDTWRSIAATWPASSDTVTLYSNATSVGTATVTRSYSAGPITAFADPARANAVVSSGAQSFNYLLIFPAALTQPQIAAVHNLLAYQFSLPTV